MSELDGLQGRLRGVFAEEARERIQRGNDHLLRLERSVEPDERRTLVEELFREAHSIKGAAAAVGLSEVESLAHDLETLLDGLRRGEEVAENASDRLLHAFDAVERAVARIVGADDPGSGRAQPEAADDVEQRDGGPPAPAQPPGPASRPAAAGPPAGGQVGGGPSTVRVPIDRLDRLLSGFGELMEVGASVEASARLVDDLVRAARPVRQRHARRPVARGVRAVSRAPGDAASATTAVAPPGSARETWDVAERVREALRDDARRMSHRLSALREQLLEARLVPLSVILGAFPRMVRDLARERNRSVELVVTGADTEVDRSVLEPLRSPLAHLVRNAVDHGIEDRHERLAAGKSADARLVVHASTEGDHVVISVHDDGRGIDVEAVRRQMIQRGSVEADVAASLSEQELVDQVFAPGFTTSASVTDVSGRGVGLDVVRHVVEQLHGTLAVRTAPGAGTTFELRLPLSAATLRCVFVSVGETAYALPALNVDGAVRWRPRDLPSTQGRPVMDVHGRACQVVEGATVLGVEPAGRPAAERWRCGVVVAAEGRRAVLSVDEILSVEDTLVRPLPPPLHRSRWTSGAVTLHTGEVAVLLNPAHVLRHIGGAPTPAAREIDDDDHVPAVIVLAEDSFTTRTMEKAILESAGYRVRAAGDGREAWDIIDREGCDLLVCDVMMPGLDGFELTGRVRSDDRFRHLPVVLVTSLDAPEYRQRGASVGADAYIAKGSFDRERLLETIRGLI